MRLAHLWLSDFRAHERCEVVLGPGTTAFVGPNAAGKTSVLEAVAWLARTSSLRGAPDSALVRVGAERAVIRAEIIPAHREGISGRDDIRAHGGPERGPVDDQWISTQPVESGVGAPPDLIEAEIAVSGRNRVLVNRRPLRRARDLLGTLRVTVFSPDDLAVVKGGPALRRAELDDLLVALSPRYDAVRTDFERVLRHRNAWLRTWSRADDPATLDVWDDQLVRVGAELVRGRLKLIGRLGPPLAKAYADLAGDAAVVTGAYEAAWAAPGAGRRPVDGAGAGPPDGIEDGDVGTRLAEAVAGARRADLERRTTTTGPHRDDWRLSLDGLDTRRCASQGEQRCLALALRLAGHRVVTEVVGEAPVLLLDDVFSELDDARAAALVAHLPLQLVPGAAVPGAAAVTGTTQALVTTTGRLPQGVPAQRIVAVRHGHLEAA